MHARYGGAIVFLERFDSGGMFSAHRGVERIEAAPGSTVKFRAFVSGSWGGGVQCFRPTLEEAKAELERLEAKLFG